MSYRALLKAWLTVLAAMIVNGAFREVVLRGLVGPSAADVLSAVMGVAIIVGLTRHLLRPIAGQPTRMLVRASVSLVVLTVAFEFLFGHYVEAKSWSALARDYELWNGRLWPIVLATLAFMPFLWGHWARKEPHRAG